MKSLASFATTAFVLSVSFASPATAYNEQQKNVLNHAAEAIAVSQRCDNLEPDFDTISMAAVMFGVPLADENHLNNLRRIIVEKQRSIEHHEDAIICATGEMLYGPEGLNVPNLLFVN